MSIVRITASEMVHYNEAIESLLQLSDRVVIVQFADKEVEMNKRHAIFHLYFWWILLKWEVPVTSEFIISSETIAKGVTDKVICNMYTKIYHTILEQKNTTQAQYDFWTSINDIHNFIFRVCGAYHSSISIVDLARLMKQKKVADIKQSLSFDETTPTNVIEEKMKLHNEQLIEALYDPMDGNNVLHPYHKLGYVNRMQLPQMILAVATRTDVNDAIIRYPIKSSFIEGMTNELEYMAESLSAKKAAFYNRTAIPHSQYFSRKQHLLTSALKYVYPGDCGTELTIPYYVHDENVDNLIGKHYVDAKGKIQTVLAHNKDELLGKTIELRSPLVCRHTDGCCEVCGGMLTKYIVEGIKVGISSAIEVTDPTTQKILSSKHLQNTLSIMYSVPEKLKDFLIVRKNSVYWKKIRENSLKDWKLGVAINDMKYISDLKAIKDASAIPEEHFSAITQIRISSISNSEHVTEIINMANGKRFPYFSRDMLAYIKDNYDRMEIGDTIWIPMDAFDISKPIFTSLVVNDSMLEFVNSVVSFLETDISKYTSAIEVLKDFSSIVYNKVGANLFHLEVMLKSYQVTSDLDASIPVVEDPNNVMFGNNMRINLERSLGCFFAFERLMGALKNPKTYVIPRGEGAFDAYVGFSNEMMS